MLTENLQTVLEKFLEVIENKQNLLLSSEDRRIGKTYILNELGFTLQALGYKVYILTPYREQEYYADKFTSCDAKDFQGLFMDKSVVIADEARYMMMYDIVGYCEYRKIPIVGYVNFDVPRKIESIEFEREYECTWIN
jgi:AAA+ ATPase superfamily predicted ATPase